MKSRKMVLCPNCKTIQKEGTVCNNCKCPVIKPKSSLTSIKKLTVRDLLLNVNITL